MRRQFSSLASARLAATGIQALSIVLLARLVPVADFGMVLTVIALQTTLLNIAGLGITPFILREYSRGHFGAVRAALTLNTSSTLLGGVLAALIPLFIVGDRPAMALVIVMLALGVSMDKNIEAQLGISIARGSSAIPFCSVLLRALAALCVFLLLVLAGVAPVLAFGLGKAGAGLLGTLHVLLVSRKPTAERRMGQGELLRTLWPLAGNNSINALRTLDTVVVTAVSGTVGAGLYAAASKTLSPFGVVANVLSSVLMPKSTTLSGAEAHRLVRRIAWCAGILALCLIPFTYASSTAMTLLFGADFAAGAGAFAWILLSLPAGGAAPLVSTILQAQGRDRFVFVNSAIFTPALLLATALGAGIGGATGAGVAFALMNWLRVAHLIGGARALRLPRLEARSLAP